MNTGTMNRTKMALYALGATAFAIGAISIWRSRQRSRAHLQSSSTTASEVYVLVFPKIRSRDGRRPRPSLIAGGGPRHHWLGAA
jgi:hypothetical protein